MKKRYSRYRILMFIIGAAKDILRIATGGYIVLSEYITAAITFIISLILDYLRLYFYEKFHEHLEKEVSDTAKLQYEKK